MLNLLKSLDFEASFDDDQTKLYLGNDCIVDVNTKKKEII